MKITKVECPILADYASLLPPYNADDTVSHSNSESSFYPHDVSQYTKDRTPLITSFVVPSTDDDADGVDSGKGQQYLLVPQGDKISVLSMTHGQLVTELIPCSIRRRRNGKESSSKRSRTTTSMMKESKEEEDAVLLINTVSLVRVGRDSPPATTVTKTTTLVNLLQLAVHNVEHSNG